MLPSQQGKSPIPVMHLDITKRYDLYCISMGEERVYENVRITAIRTLDDIQNMRISTIGGFIEIEATNGNRMMIPRNRIQAICEHAIPLAYKVLKSRRIGDENPSE